MATVELFDTIKVELFANDHNPPYVHLKYAGFKCLLTIQTAQVYAGKMPSKPLRRAQDYVVAHRDGLTALSNLTPSLPTNRGNLYWMWYC